MNIIDRRSFLKNATLGAGAVVLQPVLRSLAAEANGKAAPRRIVFFLEGNGMSPDHIQPLGLERPGNGSDKLIDDSLAKYKLPDPIGALSPFRDRMTIIQGLSHKIASGRGHSPEYGSLGCYSGAAGPIAQTIDAAVAAKLPSDVPHLG